MVLLKWHPIISRQWIHVCMSGKNLIKQMTSVWNICLTKQIKFNLVMRVCWVVRLLLQLGLTSWNPIRVVLVKTKMFPTFFKAAKISIIIVIFGNCSKICVNWFFKVDFLSYMHKGKSRLLGGLEKHSNLSSHWITFEK